MIAGTRLVRPLWHVATLASILGILLGIMAVVSAGSMAVPIFTGERMRDAMMLAFICVPVLQVALVVVGSMREKTPSGTAVSLYALAVVLLALLVALPALADWTR